MVTALHERCRVVYGDAGTLVSGRAQSTSYTDHFLVVKLGVS